jgi:hypothetical protein
MHLLLLRLLLQTVMAHRCGLRNAADANPLIPAELNAATQLQLVAATAIASARLRRMLPVLVGV